MKQRSVLRKNSTGNPKDDFWAIEISELGKGFGDDDFIPDTKRLPPPFDFERLTRFMAYGFIMAPLQHKWFAFLAKTFPLSKTSGTVPALKRVAFDQLLFAPVGMSASFMLSDRIRLSFM